MKRQRIYMVALVFFFLLYGLSPLTYDLSAKSITAHLPGGSSERSLRNASLYLIEVLCEAFSQPGEDEPENDSSPNRIFVTKKSAVQRGRFDLVPQSGRISIIAPEDPRPYFNIEIGRAEIRRSWLRKSYACLRLSSGISPPFLL